MKLGRLLGAAACAAAQVPVAAVASENVTYSYDAKGRLIRVVHSGSVNNGTTTQYSHDKADNRINVRTTGDGGNPNGNCSFSISDGSIPYQTGGFMKFLITKLGNCSTSTMISYVSRDGTAVGHYAPVSGTVTFSPSDTNKVVGINMPYGDRSLENLDVYIDIHITSGPGVVSDASGYGYYFDGG